MRLSRFLLTAFVLTFAVLYVAGRAQARDATAVIKLARVADTRTDTLWGLSNIAFTQVPTTTPVPDSAVSSVERAVIVEHDGVIPVHAVRWRTRDTVWHYAVDTDGDGSFADELQLRFRETRNRALSIWLADFSVRVRASAGSTTEKRIVPMQLAYEGKYTYARPRETLFGVWNDGTRDVSVRARPRSRNHVFGSDPVGIEIAVDLDGDGTFQIRRDTTVIAAAPREDVGRDPFIHHDAAWRVGEVSFVDATARVASIPRETRALAEGFVAPPLFVTTTAHPRTIDLVNPAVDSITVVEMWSVYCPFSAMGRGPLNALRAEFARAPVRWYSISRERDAAIVDSVLRQQPRSTTQASVSWDNWLSWNPLIVTPMYVVLDRDGRVLLHESGGDRAPLLRATLARALKRP